MKLTLGPLHKWDCEPMTIALQALSLVEKAKPVQALFALRLRDQWSMWMQDGSCIMVTWIICPKPPLGGRPNTRPWDYGVMNAHNRWFILFYHMWGPAWIESHWNSIWLKAQSHMTSHHTWESVITLHGFGGALGRLLDALLSGSQNFVVKALGSCVKWPLASLSDGGLAHPATLRGTNQFGNHLNVLLGPFLHYVREVHHSWILGKF